MLIKNAKFRVFLYPYSNFLLYFCENDLIVQESMIFRKAPFILFILFTLICKKFIMIYASKSC